MSVTLFFFCISTIKDFTSTKNSNNQSTGENQSSVKLWCLDKAVDFCNSIDIQAENTIESNLNELSNMSSICKTDISNVAKDICKVFINSA